MAARRAARVAKRASDITWPIGTSLITRGKLAPRSRARTPDPARQFQRTSPVADHVDGATGEAVEAGADAAHRVGRKGRARAVDEPVLGRDGGRALGAQLDDAQQLLSTVVVGQEDPLAADGEGRGAGDVGV